MRWLRTPYVPVHLCTCTHVRLCSIHWLRTPLHPYTCTPVHLNNLCSMRWLRALLHLCSQPAVVHGARRRHLVCRCTRPPGGHATPAPVAGEPVAGAPTCIEETGRGGYREPPELPEEGNKESSGAEGNHRKTGREAERPPRSSSGGQPGPMASNHQPNHCSKAQH